VRICSSKQHNTEAEGKMDGVCATVLAGLI
jgi:hypothetical protein